MLFRLILRQMWYERRSWGVVLLGWCLVAAFSALYPLYRHEVSRASARYVLEQIRPEEANITLSNPQPIDPAAQTLLGEELGDIVADDIPFSRAVGDPAFPNAGKICGYDYVPGEQLNAASRYAASPPAHCYRIYRFGTLQQLFSLHEGRWPQDLASPPAASADQQLTTPATMGQEQLEAVITVAVASETGIAVGDRLVVGDSYDRAVVVKIVGLVEPVLDPGSVFWYGNAIVLTGGWTSIGDDQRFDIGLILPETAFQEWVPLITSDITHYWWFSVNPTAITGERLEALDVRLRRLSSKLRLTHPSLGLLSGLNTIIAQFNQEAARTDRPLRIFAGAILVLLLYQLAVTEALIMAGQGNRGWLIMFSRGGSVGQLMRMLCLPLGIVGAVAAVVGVFGAELLLLLMQRVGLLRSLSDGTELQTGEQIARVFLYSLLGAAVTASLSMLVIWLVVRRRRVLPPRTGGVLPATPVWARTPIASLLLAAGLTLVLRSYFLVSGDLGQSLADVVQAPRSLAQYVASNRLGSGAGSFYDPFILVGPGLILAGASLLWLRVFSVALRLANRLFSRQRGLVLPLSLWCIGRNSGVYAALVLTIVGTLTLGIAAAALGATHAAGAWELAREEVGADVRLEYPLSKTPVVPAESALPNVMHSTTLMRLSDSEAQITLVGIDSTGFMTAFPQEGAAIQPLADQVPVLPGLVLPEGAETVQLQVYAEPSPDGPTQTNLEVQLLDGRGVPFSIAMSTPDPYASGQFVEYRALLPGASTIPPWRLTGLQLLTRQGDSTEFSHTIYLDDVAAVDHQGHVTIVENFEDGSLTRWTGASDQSSQALAILRNTTHAARGGASLQVDYVVRYVRFTESQPLIKINEVTLQIPVVVSQSFAELKGQRANSIRQPLKIGDTGGTRLELPLGSFWLPYQIVGVVEEFPTVPAGDPFIIAPFDALRLMLNASNQRAEHFDANQVWLELDGHRPGHLLSQAIAAMPGVARVDYAWDRYQEIRRQPSLNAITGLLFAGFWVSLGLCVLYLLVHLVTMIAYHAAPLAVLHTIGWSTPHLWRFLAAEQMALILTTLGAGVLLATFVVYLLMPFVLLIDSTRLHLPLFVTAGLVFVFIGILVLLQGVTAFCLRRATIYRAWRCSERY